MAGDVFFAYEYTMNYEQDTSSCREKDVLGMHRIEHRSSAAGLVGIKSQISELRPSVDDHSNSKEDNPEGTSSGSFSKNRYFRKRKTKIDLRSSEHDNLLGEESRNLFPSQFGKKTMPYPIKRSKSVLGKISHSRIE